MSIIHDDQIAMRSRVRTAADEVEQLDEALALARERRNDLIVEAVEQGTSYREVARWAKLKQPSVSAILANS